MHVPSTLLPWSAVLALALGCSGDAVAIYDACATGDTCAEGTCTPTGFVATDGMAGVCTTSCTAGGACPGGGVCVVDSGRGRCWRPCSGDRACPAGMACRTIVGSEADVCVPTAGAGVPALGPCTTGEACERGTTCTPSGWTGGAPGNLCTRSCSEREPCPGIGNFYGPPVCVRATTGATASCYLQCIVNPYGVHLGCRPGTICMAITAVGGPPIRLCVPAG